MTEQIVSDVVKMVNQDGDTALHIAIKRGHTNIAKELLQCPECIAIADMNGIYVFALIRHVSTQ